MRKGDGGRGASLNRGEGIRQSSRKTGSGLGEHAAGVSAGRPGVSEGLRLTGRGSPGECDEGKRSERAEGLQQCSSWGPGVWPGEGGS